MLDVVEYAATLAIRVIPEFDNPGHTRAIGFDPEFKEIVRCFNKDWAFTVPNAYKIKGGSPTGVLDPSYSKTFDLIRGLFVEFDEIFPDTFLHLGGDEVLTSCYNENPNIKTFMNQHGLTTLQSIFEYHLKEARKVLTEVNPNKKALYWMHPDNFDMSYTPGDILMYWGPSDGISQLKTLYPQNKYIFSPGDYYYTDCGSGNKYGSTTWCEPYKTFWTIYQFEPSKYLNDGSVLGSEVVAFSENADDLNIHGRLWPRSAAMPDKLWSPLVATDLKAISARQTAFGNYLAQRGIPRSPITEGWCELTDYCF